MIEAVGSICEGSGVSNVEAPPLSGVHLKVSAVEDGQPWPEDIPRDYAELYKMYATFVAQQVRRHNTVRRNFEELYAYVWKRLVEKRVIKLFMESVAEKLPTKMTGVQVIDFFGITPKQWDEKMRRYHLGTPIYSKHSPKVIIGRRQGAWMPTPLNAEQLRDMKQKRLVDYIFDTEDIIILSTMETQRPDGTVAGPFRNMNPKVDEIPVKATKAYFQAYLAKSIYSDYFNWCRTIRRKWSLDKPMYLRPDNEEDADWERNLVDPGGARQETQTIISQACSRLSASLHKEMAAEVVTTGLKCKPIEQTEMQMFELLEQGVPLPEVVKKLEIPDRVRRAVLRSIQDVRAA